MQIRPDGFARMSGDAGHAGSDEVAQEDAVIAARLLDGYVNRWWLEPLFTGSYPQDVWEHREYKPEIHYGDMELIGTPPDFIGVNYYTRFVVRPVRSGGRMSWNVVSAQERGMPFTTMGWEIYPEGLLNFLLRLKSEYGDTPIYITENGMAYDDPAAEDERIHDDYRIDYLRRHIDVCDKAIAAGVKLRGYFVWTLMDNFEWEMGWNQRFGIIRVDYETLQRTVKDSGWWYSDFIKQSKRQGIE